ncbi:glycosyltransferase [Duganella dendranthematis]|uniref:Glycosyltransferase n=1 Tax=Duganella dendranthematis TaxID=2728021 RepID=A0ABX6MCK9_9BURK|nr:glycosyltransferase [Duganella dendranthematis]QJD92080.1 glycosyltransferase [Duganella dendranthematis]
MAKIDILLPVKNGKDFLAESIDSILAQTFQDWRLLVLDHGSTDGSREMAEEYQQRDPRVEVHSFPEARGLSGLLNCGLDIADCEFVMRHDADDICYPDRMALALAAFAQYPDCIAIGGQADVIDASGKLLGEMLMPVGSARVTAASLFRNPIAHPTAMLRFDAVKQMGIRYGIDLLRVLPEDQRLEVPALAEDYFLFGQLAILGKCANIPHKLIRYRWHGNNVSATRFDDQMAVSLDISRSLARSFCIMHQLPWFDPAPFCNHGGILLDVDGRGNFDAEYARMADAVTRGLGDSDELRRELRYRKAIATRREASLLWRFHRFRADNTPEAGEWTAIRSWLLRRFPGRPRMSVAGLPA